MNALIGTGLAALVHLWQTTLVLGALWILAVAFRRAPASWQHRLWSLGLLKLILPLGFLGTLATRVMEGFAPASGVHAISVLAPVRAVLDPISGLDRTGTVLGTAAAGFVAVWLAGASIGLLRLARELGAAGRMASAPRARLPRAACGRLVAALAGTGIPAPAVRVVEAGAMPVVVGLRRPVILVPRPLLDALPPAELRAVLLHEEAHRRRLDPLRLAAYRALAAVFFFYPPLGFLLARLRETAELACDEGALHAGALPEDLSRAVARTVRLGLSPVRFAAAAGSGDASLLRRRFERLSDPRRYAPMTRHRLLFSAAALLVAALSFAPLSGCSDRSRVTETGTGADKVPDAGATAAVQPVPVKTQSPEYPEAARKSGLEGQVLVQVHVEPDGSVGTVVARPDQDAPRILTDAALAAARQWRFKPLGDAAPKGTDVVIPFDFKLQDKQQ